MAIEFDPIEKIIQLDTFNVSGRDIWTAMVDWSVLGDNLKYGVGMTQIGGLPPIALYLTLERGWRIRPQEADGVTVLSGYVETSEGTTPMTATLGRWHRETKREAPVQAVLVESAGLTQAQEAKLDQNNSSIASILEDTNELQGNQGNAGLTPEQATELSGIKAKTDILTFNGADVKATLDGEIVTTDTESRNASKADISGLSTFDYTSDEVVTDTASRNASKADVSGLSTFDAATDAVANVTLVATTTTNTDMRGTDLGDLIEPDNTTVGTILADLTAYTASALPKIHDILADTNELQINQEAWLTADISGLSTFNPAVDTVANVTLVDTTTTNTDMRGTDNVIIPVDISTFDPNTDFVITDTASRDASKGLSSDQNSKLETIVKSTNVIPALL